MYFSLTTRQPVDLASLEDRQGGSVGHSKYKCNICMQAAPDPTLGRESLIQMRVREGQVRGFQGTLGTRAAQEVDADALRVEASQGGSFCNLSPRSSPFPSLSCNLEGLHSSQMFTVNRSQSGIKLIKPDSWIIWVFNFNSTCRSFRWRSVQTSIRELLAPPQGSL